MRAAWPILVSFQVMIVDAHVHLVTARMIRNAKRRFDKIRPGLIDRVQREGRKFINPAFVEFLDNTTTEKLAEMWAGELDRNKIDHAIFLPVGGELSDLDEFVALDPGRFSGYVFLANPLSKSSVSVVRRWAKTGFFRGIKLYPCLQMFSIADKRVFPLYEAAAELGMPVLIHFGITQAPVADYRYTNPLDLKLPSKLFPDTKFIIAHFGAGFFREVLLLGFHSENIYVDTSGTNNWRLYTPEAPSLARIFKRTLDVYGAEKILFGTDSALNEKTGYRTFVLKEQRKAMADLKLKKKQRDMIMGGNAARLFGLRGGTAG